MVMQHLRHPRGVPCAGAYRAVREHAANPILIDRRSARPGGAFIRNGEGRLFLPVQDGTLGYGGGLGLSELRKLDSRAIPTVRAETCSVRRKRLALSAHSHAQSLRPAEGDRRDRGRAEENACLGGAHPAGWRHQKTVDALLTRCCAFDRHSGILATLTTALLRHPRSRQSPPFLRKRVPCSTPIRR
jgi:hypothetical protein